MPLGDLNRRWWFLGVAAGVLALGFSVRLEKACGCGSEAKTTIGALTRSQKAHYQTYQRFATASAALREFTGLPSSPDNSNYLYRVHATPQAAFQSATPRQLRRPLTLRLGPLRQTIPFQEVAPTWVSGVFITGASPLETVSITCMGSWLEERSDPPAPSLQATGQPACPAGFAPVAP